MTVYCDHCDRAYDDTTRWTICPHDEFPMRCTVSFHGRTRVCRSLEELNQFLAEVLPEVGP